MTMTFSIHESIQPNYAFEYVEQWTEITSAASRRVQDDIHIIREKLQAPYADSLIDRPRLTNLVLRSQTQFPATLITGRSGTGKTAIAAAAAAGQKTAWYTVESAETDWSLFSRYLSASLSTASSCPNSSPNVSQNEIAAYLVDHFAWGDAESGEAPALIVLDDVHHIFDAPWFTDFFDLLLYSLPSKTHLLLLCRSKPPNPLWRLRSKQMLNVLDEKVIAFNLCETQTLFDALGVPVDLADQALQDSFGRVSKLLEFARERSAILPSSLKT